MRQSRNWQAMANKLSGSLALQVLYPILALVLVIVLWAVLVDLYDIPKYVLPSPMQVWEHIQKDWLALLAGFRTTFLEFLFGFLIGAAAGFIFAVIMDASRSARGVLYPILIASQAIPVVAI